MKMVDIPALEAKNGERWQRMHISAHRLPQFDTTAKRLCEPAAKAVYSRISSTTGVPWFVIAVIHEREASGPPAWDRSIAQGDPLSRRSTHVPAGRGPFIGADAFYNGAVDALTECAPRAAHWKLWTAGGTLTLLEEYNGLGYAARGVPSAYVWSGSDQYVSGKFVADHVYRANAVDVQEGCAPILSRMLALDATIQFAEPA